ncbi:MAG TPA: N-acetylneuraminate synthase [Chloroflexi bacterium]|nr:N-acetylneuraminate synthase [Chloroflexota bacterium]
MRKTIKIGDYVLGDGYPAFIVGEIGINHNGDIEIAKRLIDAAAEAGCNAVKFQKRNPEQAVPAAQRDVMRETPWGFITYLEYKYKVEFGYEEYAEIDRYCREKGILWFASCWDEDSVDFIEQFSPCCYKAASASLTDLPLLQKVKNTGRPLVISTGMSTMEEIAQTIKVLGTDNLVVCHSTSAYPCPNEELNLRMIQTLREKYDCPIGYSGHEVGLQTTCAAVVLGALYIERHITLDRAMWGSDQAASVEPHGIKRLVRDIRVIEAALGDGVKQVYESEMIVRNRLRRN